MHPEGSCSSLSSRISMNSYASENVSDDFSNIKSDELFSKKISKVEHVAKEILLLLKLAVQLWSYLGLGWRWTINFYRLILYAVLLLPGFLQLVYMYFFSPRVLRHLNYGSKPRQQLDIYLPPSNDLSKKCPVLIYITGGAWTIGYKGWGAYLSSRMSDQGFVVACLDYRNFPQGNAIEMLEDVNTGISWVNEKIGEYGGDPQNISICGQSAGGQLGMLTLIKQVERVSSGREVKGSWPAWDPSAVRCFIGISGAYDLEGLATHLHRRGLYKNLFDQIMSINGRPAYKELSPLRTAKALPASSGCLFPKIVLVHGTADKSVPYVGSVQLHESLQAKGVDSTCRLFDGKTHTSFLFEDPMAGGRDILIEILMEAVENKETRLIYNTLCPKVLCQLAGWVCPF